VAAKTLAPDWAVRQAGTAHVPRGANRAVLRYAGIGLALRLRHRTPRAATRARRQVRAQQRCAALCAQQAWAVLCDCALAEGMAPGGEKR